MTLHLCSKVLERLFPEGSQEAFELLLKSPPLRGPSGHRQAGAAPSFAPTPPGVSSTWLDSMDSLARDPFLIHLLSPLRDHHRLGASRLATGLVDFSIPTYLRGGGGGDPSYSPIGLQGQGGGH